MSYFIYNDSGCHNYGYEGYDCDYADCNYSLGDDWYDKWRIRCRKKCGTCIGDDYILPGTLFGSAEFCCLSSKLYRKLFCFNFKFLGAGVNGVILKDVVDLVAREVRLDQGHVLIHLHKMEASIVMENRTIQKHAIWALVQV